jgi:hypothetical protein
MIKTLTYTFFILVIGTSYSITNGFINQKAVADLCVGIIAYSAIAGNGGDGGEAIAGDVGDGGTCYAVTIGNHCGGSTGSNEPRCGAGGAGGDAEIGDSHHEGGSNSENETTTITDPIAIDLKEATEDYKRM